MSYTIPIVSFLIGLASAWILRIFVRRQWIQQAEEEAQSVIEEAQNRADEIKEHKNERVKEFEAQSYKRFEKETSKKIQKNDEMAVSLKSKEDQLKLTYQQRMDIVNKKKKLTDEYYARVSDKKAKYNKFRQRERDLNEKITDKLIEFTEVDREKVLEGLKQKLLEKQEIEANKLLQRLEEQTLNDSERLARRYLNLVLCRFERPYCPDRGIGFVIFPNEKAKNKVIGPEEKNLRILEKICGVDITINEEFNSAATLGFDPVRRELARIALEKLIHEREVNEKRIQEIVEKTKKDLFKLIRKDGDKLSRELQMRDLHPEIRNMMGALKYRYSFSQNQFYHCAEVGWLCGLLSAELGLNPMTGRRAGLLHDLGKAMDHSMEGGHAVIGADFIQKHGEKDDVVHAVRAHHYDETPSTNLAFLVIAADAISGARPGARRSTIDTYTQKMEDLQKIGNSFDGVSNTYVLSAGREVRVVVNSDKIDDVGALTLSKDIATKIEKECSYPGQIRVTVVRESQAVDFAK